MAQQQKRREDGRTARRLENRQRILDALFELIAQQSAQPTLQAIADRAGVTVRTLLNHFPDTASMLRAAIVRGGELAVRDLPQVPEHCVPSTRVRKFFREAGLFYDRYAAIRWALMAYSGESPGFDMRQYKRTVLARIEERVLLALGTAGATLRRNVARRGVLRMVIDPLSWRNLRLQQGHSRDAAASRMALAVLSLAR